MENEQGVLDEVMTEGEEGELNEIKKRDILDKKNASVDLLANRFPNN